MSIDFSRRDFIKNTSLLAGGAGIFSALPASIRKAVAINPTKGSTFEDAEHIVLLMQENRSFDHCFGALKGVRGFNDRNILKLPDGNPVWLQTNEKGKSRNLNLKSIKLKTDTSVKDTSETDNYERAFLESNKWGNGNSID